MLEKGLQGEVLIGTIIWYLFEQHGEYDFSKSDLLKAGKLCGLNAAVLLQAHAEWILGDRTYHAQCPNEDLFFKMYGVYSASSFF